MTDPVVTALAEYGWIAILAYIVIKEVIAPIIQKWLPENAKRAAETAKRAADRQEKREAQEAECRDREARALEAISEALAMNGARLQTLENGHSSLIAGLTEANKGIAVLLDRRATPRKKQQSATAAAD